MLTFTSFSTATSAGAPSFCDTIDDFLSLLTTNLISTFEYITQNAVEEMAVKDPVVIYKRATIDLKNYIKIYASDVALEIGASSDDINNVILDGTFFDVENYQCVDLTSVINAYDDSVLRLSEALERYSARK
jgi:hypothetical protein